MRRPCRPAATSGSLWTSTTVRGVSSGDEFDALVVYVLTDHHDSAIVRVVS
jgi:hypothetical protein